MMTVGNTTMKSWQTKVNDASKRFSKSYTDFASRVDKYAFNFDYYCS